MTQTQKKYLALLVTLAANQAVAQKKVCIKSQALDIIKQIEGLDPDRKQGEVNPNETKCNKALGFEESAKSEDVLAIVKDDNSKFCTIDEQSLIIYYFGSIPVV